tara:strand:- start:1363 stop:2328 length:966 start_codon:yes stop_codon:yes gene_type:complete
MKHYFCTELGFTGKLPHSATNLRALETWIKVLDATHLNIYETLKSSSTHEGICWLVIPKWFHDKADHPLAVHDVVGNLKTKFEKVYCIQEGETTWWSSKSVQTQVWIYNQFSQSDRIYTQNSYDQKYLKGLFPDKHIPIIRPIMDPEMLGTIKRSEVSNEKAIIAGPLTNEYLGFNSNLLFQMCGISVDIPPMGESRMPKDSKDMAESIGASYLPYRMWKEWMEHLSQYKYGMFMVNAIGAATFPLNCGYFGIPCIGDNRADTQRLIFPELSVDYLDYEEALKLIKLLQADEIFYNDTSQRAIERFKLHFNVNTFKQLLEL